MEEINKLHGLRRDYDRHSLDEPLMHSNPMIEFRTWLTMAIDMITADATATVLSTVSKSGRPSSRVVLLKDADEDGFTFFTNYKSRKGIELAENNFASLLFYWKEMDRQIRIEGKVKKTNVQLSNLYFNSRPYESKIAASVSQQSKVLKSRSVLENAYGQIKSEGDKKEVKRPRRWGGYILYPDTIEFWQGRPSRLHDRFIYRKEKNKWVKTRLYP